MERCVVDACSREMVVSKKKEALSWLLPTSWSLNQ
jgi:hypothetical protein